MSNTFMNGLQNATNYTFTENGAITHKTTKSDLLDMFALGGAYRNRTDEDCINLFKNAYAENSTYAMKCLFYLRDVRGGQGERRFFRVVMKWLAAHDKNAVLRNLEQVPEFGRWDDLYIFVGTPVEHAMFELLKAQLVLDVQCKTPSLLAKWLKSENTSSAESRRLGDLTRKAFGMNHKQYRKTLSVLRERINVLERLMSAGKWDEIEFDKIPSRAGLIYRNAFARRDIIKAKYEAFAKDADTKVNAKVLNPVEIAHECLNDNYSSYYRNRSIKSDVERAMLQKYWDNLEDYYHGNPEMGIAVVDVSGSMWGQPLEAAVAMGAYIAERGKGPFQNHFITFSDSPSLIRFDGVDVYDKFNRAARADWGGSTNVEAVLDLLLRTAIQNKCPAEDMPARLYIFSDMEFNSCVTTNQTRSRYGYYRSNNILGEMDTLFEATAKKWAKYGYNLPKVIFWNLNARNNNIPAIGPGFSYVSGFNMNMLECILSGRDGYDLMMEKLNSERYAVIK